MLNLPNTNRLLTETEVSEITGKAIQTIRNERCERRGIPYVKVGRRSVRYLPQDILEFIKRHRIDPEKAA